MKMNKTIIRRGLLGISGLVAVAAMGLVGIAPASAAPVAAKQSCAVFLDTGQTVCVKAGADLDQAAADQTGRTLVISKGSSVSTLAKPVGATNSRALVVPLSSFLQGRFYDDQNYGGSYLETFGAGSCTSSLPQWEEGPIPSSWYGRISSFQGYSNCKIRIWENTNYTGATLGNYSSKAYVGDAMNDRTKSVQFGL
jgi:hypothetical protein